ncbi:MAG: hypothetical protein R8M46_05235, partial [Ghiorsea sp.]
MQIVDLNKRVTLFFMRLFIAFVFLFFVLRLAFLWVYPEDFSSLSLNQIIYAMLKGAWFMDSSITMVFLGIPFLFAYLPIKWFVSRCYLNFLSWYVFIVFFVFALISIGDLIYFGMVHRHTGHELAAALQSSPEAMLDMVLSAYWMQLLLLVVAAGAMAKVWYKWMMPRHEIEYLKLGLLRIPFFVVMFLLILLTMRGGIESKPIQSVFAYNEGSLVQGHLTLNGAFAVFHSLHASKMRLPAYMDQEDATAIVKDIFKSEHEVHPNKDYPFMRERTSPNPSKDKPNIVVLLIESWDPDFIDISRELAGKKTYDVTPNYNALAKQGRLYTNFYANGQRSLDGI